MNKTYAKLPDQKYSSDWIFEPDRERVRRFLSAFVALLFFAICKIFGYSAGWGEIVWFTIAFAVPTYFSVAAYFWFLGPKAFFTSFITSLILFIAFIYAFSTTIESTYHVRVGAICLDGTISGATGRGACSHHGGVLKWVEKPITRLLATPERLSKTLNSFFLFLPLIFALPIIYIEEQDFEQKLKTTLLVTNSIDTASRKFELEDGLETSLKPRSLNLPINGPSLPERNETNNEASQIICKKTFEIRSGNKCWLVVNTLTNEVKKICSEKESAEKAVKELNG